MGTFTDFENFYKSLRLSKKEEDLKTNRFHAIVKRLNNDFYQSENDSAHSFYVGSHGRGTDIYTSDIDIAFVLPYYLYAKYNNYSSNGQSQLLQSLKNSISKTYSSTDVGGDGQVVVVSFSDGMVFEIVPCFLNKDGSYTYPDSNNGGIWKIMYPKQEIEEFNKLNNEINGNLKKFCRMIREWNRYQSVCIKGALIDTLVYRFLSNYSDKDKSFAYYDWFTRDFMSFLINQKDVNYWRFPGGHWNIHRDYSFHAEAKEAYDNAVAGIDYYSEDYNYSAKQSFKKIFGPKFSL